MKFPSEYFLIALFCVITEDSSFSYKQMNIAVNSLVDSLLLKHTCTVTHTHTHARTHAHMHTHQLLFNFLSFRKHQVAVAGPNGVEINNLELRGSTVTMVSVFSTNLLARLLLFR